MNGLTLPPRSLSFAHDFFNGVGVGWPPPPLHTSNTNNININNNNNFNLNNSGANGHNPSPQWPSMEGGFGGGEVPMGQWRDGEMGASLNSSFDALPNSIMPPMVASGGTRSLVLDTVRGELVNAAKLTPKEILEAKALAASKSHSEAERRRRERINSHLTTLRTLLPCTTKTDKASLLAEVIDKVKTLKRQVAEIYDFGTMPTEADELKVERDNSAFFGEEGKGEREEEGSGRFLIRVSLCCGDRPDLMRDLQRALDSLNLQTVKAEMSTLGGRVRNVFVMALKDCSQASQFSISSVQEVLKQVMEKSGGEGFVNELSSPSPTSSQKRQKQV